MSIFADDPLLQKPGEKFVYTTYGYTLIGCAMEVATGRNFTTLMEEQLFRPVGMTATRNDSVSAIIPNRALGFLGAGTEWTVAATRA